MARPNSNAFFKNYIKEIEIKNFRIIKQIEFNPGQQLNLISGKNGTAKSTILGMIAQGFSFNPKVIYSIKRKDYEDTVTKNSLTESDLDLIEKYESTLTYSGTKFESLVNEHFKLTPSDSYGEEHVSVTLESKESFKIKSSDYEDRQNPRLVTRRTNAQSDIDIDTASSNLIVPVIYTGLNRLLPIVQSGKITETTPDLSDSDSLEIHSLYESILLKRYTNNPKSISSKQKKNSLAFIPNERPSETISSGEDNIGQILLALFSFKKLKNQYADYKGGILLIDELDSTLYPAAQLKLLEVLYQKSLEYGIQIFATTHSLDIINHAITMKMKSNFNRHAIKIMKLNNDRSLKIEEVTNINRLKNEFHVDTNKKELEEKVPIYFEDKEASFVFKNLVSHSKQKKLKFNPSFTLGCNELIKLRDLKIPEFINQSIVCLDGDTPAPVRAKNYINLPIVDDVPPEQFVYNIIKDASSDYWLHTKGYDHTHLLNNPHNMAIQSIIRGDYGNGNDTNPGFYNTVGSPYKDMKPRKVWKAWFKEEKTKFRGKNNPVKYWANQDENSIKLEKFLSDYEKAFEYVSIAKGIIN